MDTRQIDSLPFLSWWQCVASVSFSALCRVSTCRESLKLESSTLSTSCCHGRKWYVRMCDGIVAPSSVGVCSAMSRLRFLVCGFLRLSSADRCCSVEGSGISWCPEQNYLRYWEQVLYILVLHDLLPYNVSSCLLQSADITAGQEPENVHKNRYRDILPYEVRKQLLWHLVDILYCTSLGLGQVSVAIVTNQHLC